VDWIYVLTRIDGRISRQPFWLAFLPMLVIETVASNWLSDQAGAVVSLLLAYPQFAVFAKRGHDRDVPTWVVGICFAGSVMLNLIVLLGISGPMNDLQTWFLVFIVPFALLALVLLVDFGFRRGVAGPNRYGPNPLEEPTPARSN
jgi:uncharacterized membrane protein YhaH (DUF805 family)